MFLKEAKYVANVFFWFKWEIVMQLHINKLCSSLETVWQNSMSFCCLEKQINFMNLRLHGVKALWHHNQALNFPFIMCGIFWEQRTYFFNYIPQFAYYQHSGWLGILQIFSPIQLQHGSLQSQVITVGTHSWSLLLTYLRLSITHITQNNSTNFKVAVNKHI